jgi:hypothetical protein
VAEFPQGARRADGPALPLPVNYRTVRELLELASAQVDSAHNIARLGGNASAPNAKAAATLRRAAEALDPTLEGLR